MPTSTWTCELSLDAYTYTATPNPTGTDPSGGNRAGWWRVGLEAICLPLLDQFPPGDPVVDDGGFYFFTGVSDGTSFDVGFPGIDFPDPGSFQGVTFRLNNEGTGPNSAPPVWTPIFLVPTIFNEDPALVSGTVILSITKDYDGDLMTFVGPLGTQTVALTAIDALPGGPFAYHNTTPMRPRGYSEWHRHPTSNFGNPPYDLTDTVSYYDLIGKENGVAYDTTALSTGDPGNWYPLATSYFVEGTGTFNNPGLPPLWTFSQLATRQKYEGAWLAANEPVWDHFYITRRRMPLMSGTDMATAHESGVLWRTSADGGMVLIERSFDNAHSWEMFLVFADSAVTNSSPTVNWYNHRLAVTWYDGTNIKEAHSLNGGATWGMPVTLPFTGTNPRRLTENNGGGSYYFYFDAGPNLLVSITYDNGGSYDGPFTVAAGLTAQQVDADFSPDGSIVVSYFVAGVWTQKRSRDLGRTWV